MRHLRYILILVLCLGASMPLTAQVNRNRFGNSSGNNSFGRGSNTRNNSNNSTINATPTETADANDSTDQQPRGVVYHEEIPDSILLNTIYNFHYKAGNVRISEIEHPTFSGVGLQYFDRLDRIDGNFYLSKGGIGLSHYNIYPTYGNSLEWQLQPNVNIGYGKTLQTVNYYQTLRPYTVLGYASSLNNEYQIKASHTQNIIPRWNVSLDIDFLNPEAIYANSQAKNTYIDFTSNYYSDDSRYQAYLSVLWQKLRMGENGGLTDDSVFNNTSSGMTLSGLPVVSSIAHSLFNEFSVFTHQSYNLVTQVDRVVQRSRIEQIDSNDIDTIYYDDTIRIGTPHILNLGVLNLDVAWRQNKRALYDSIADSIKTNVIDAFIYWTNDAYHRSRWKNPLVITAGLKPRYIHINQHDVLFDNLWSVSAFGEGTISIWKGVLKANAEYTYGSDYLANDRRACASYYIQPDSIHHLSLAVSMQNKAPDHFLYHYNICGMNWDNDNLHKTQVMRIDARYAKDNHYDISLSASNIDNLAYLNKNIIPQQATEAFWLLQAKFIYHLKLWGWLRYDMQQMLQYSSDDNTLSVPLWTTKNSLYTDVPILRHALSLQMGVDIRYHTRFYADAYSPQAGAFYRQRDVKIGNYVWGDFFVNLQLKRAVIYAKLGHLNSIWENNPNYFVLPHYPGNKLGLYYGVIWKFFD